METGLEYCVSFSAHTSQVANQTKHSEWSVIFSKVLTETKTCLPGDCMIILFLGNSIYYKII